MFVRGQNSGSGAKTFEGHFTPVVGSWEGVDVGFIPTKTVFWYSYNVDNGKHTNCAIVDWENNTCYRWYETSENVAMPTWIGTFIRLNGTRFELQANVNRYSEIYFAAYAQ